MVLTALPRQDLEEATTSPPSAATDYREVLQNRRSLLASRARANRAALETAKKEAAALETAKKKADKEKRVHFEGVEDDNRPEVCPFPGFGNLPGAQAPQEEFDNCAGVTTRFGPHSPRWPPANAAAAAVVPSNKGEHPAGPSGDVEQGGAGAAPGEAAEAASPLGRRFRSLSLNSSAAGGSPLRGKDHAGGQVGGGSPKQQQQQEEVEVQEKGEMPTSLWKHIQKYRLGTHQVRGIRKMVVPSEETRQSSKPREPAANRPARHHSTCGAQLQRGEKVIDGQGLGLSRGHMGTRSSRPASGSQGNIRRGSNASSSAHAESEDSGDSEMMAADGSPDLPEVLLTLRKVLNAWSASLHPDESTAKRDSRGRPIFKGGKLTEAYTSSLHWDSDGKLENELISTKRSGWNAAIVGMLLHCLMPNERCLEMRWHGLFPGFDKAPEKHVMATIMDFIEVVTVFTAVHVAAEVQRTRSAAFKAALQQQKPAAQARADAEQQAAVREEELLTSISSSSRPVHLTALPCGPSAFIRMPEPGGGGNMQILLSTPAAATRTAASGVAEQLGHEDDSRPATNVVALPKSGGSTEEATAMAAQANEARWRRTAAAVCKGVQEMEAALQHVDMEAVHMLFRAAPAASQMQRINRAVRELPAALASVSFGLQLGSEVLDGRALAQSMVGSQQQGQEQG